MKQRHEFNAVGSLCSKTIQYTFENGVVNGEITDLTERVADFASIEGMAKAILKSEGNQFSIKKWRNKVPYIHATPVGRRVLVGLSLDLDLIKKEYPLHEHNPLIEAFNRHADKNERRLIAANLHSMSIDLIQSAVDELNAFVSELKNEGGSKEFKTKVKKFQRVANKNHQGLRECIAILFDNHAKILSVRLDLYIKEEFSESITAEQANEYINKYIKILNNDKPGEVGEHFLFYAIKREYGLKKGYHFHSLQLFNGRLTQQAMSMACWLGKIWNEIVTEGLGSHFNCQLSKDRYQHCGIGMIEHHDQDMREGLRIATAYMTKPDYYIRVVDPGGGRNFRRSNKPKHTPNKPGPKRSK